MRKIVSILFVTFITSLAHAQTTPPPAEKVIKEACASAAKAHKQVFVIFHASWCGWCHKMDTAMNDVSVKQAFTDNYEIRHITVKESGDKKVLENPGGNELLTQYHGGDQGIPYWLVLDTKGKMLADSRVKDAASGKMQNVGCPTQQEEVDYFVGVLQQTSKMKPAELDAVRTRFSLIGQQH
ncbi:thioredoxin family protein [Chitinophaga sp. 30R24]|uniref:thioredoxin family protein n=1 Tax=Chitinophaga sp. 30R24 TaxID=3248838 RepID=UPI003B8FE9F2